MSLRPILPIAGASDELIRVLNDRFREVAETPTPETPQAPAVTFEHARRTNPNLVDVGLFGQESDRGVTYQVQTVGSSKAWVYTSGEMAATAANRPADLGANDAGFQFLATDTLARSRWSGTAWVDYGATAAAADTFYSARSSSIGTVTVSSLPVGQYLVSVFLGGTTSGTGNVTWAFSWTSGGASRSLTTGAFSLNAGSVTTGYFAAYPLHIDAGTSFAYSTTYTGSGAYEFAINLRKL